MVRREMCWGLCLIVGLTNAVAGQPSREKGLAIHMMPKRIAEKDTTGRLKPGFLVSETMRRSEEEGGVLVFQSAAELIDHYESLPAKVRENGIWVVTTHPDAYSDGEKKMLEDLKATCKKKDILLFLCRGSELPDGWKRVDME